MMSSQAIAALPSYNELLALDWIPSVWSTYQRLLETETAEDWGAPRRYLELQYRLNTEPRLPINIAQPHKINRKALIEGLEQILHPYQLPLTVEDLLIQLEHYKVQISYTYLKRICNDLCDADSPEYRLHRFHNPYRQQRHVYCSNQFQMQPQLGDKVVELLHKRSRRFGVVVGFKTYRLNGKLYPIIQTETMKCFVDPQRIIIVERLEPFAQQPKRRFVSHTTTVSLA